MADSWVINASPVILLAKVGLISFVPLLAQRLVVPEPVAGEILAGGRTDEAAAWIEGEGRKFIGPAASELESLREARIGEGEKAVIAWAVAHPGFIAVLDDAEARAIASRHGVALIGTVGVVLRLKNAGLIPAVRPHLLSIRQAGGFIGDSLFRKALHDAGEQP